MRHMRSAATTPTRAAGAAAAVAGVNTSAARVQRAASTAPLPVRQPWLLAIAAIAALAAVCAAGAKVAVRRRRG
jgi:hypothetical protein